LAVKLTKRSVAAAELPAGKTDHVLWDSELPGFGVRLRGDSKRWLIQYRIRGRQGRESLGDVRRISIEDARRIARQRFASIELGIDPAAEKAKARTAAAAAQLSLSVVSNRYLSVKEGVLRPSTYRAAVRHFNVHWQPFRDRPLDTIKRADVALRLGELTKQCGRVGAARARTNLSALFAWAMGEGLCEQNPVVSTNNPDRNPVTRERLLSDTELATIWNACGDDDFGKIVKLLMLSGCRRIEIGGLRWDELDLNAGILKIPGARTKNGRDLSLPLPAPAASILRSIPRVDGSTHVFRGGGFTSWSEATSALRARIAATGATLAHWTIHDIRRSVRTGMGRLGVQPHIAELVIGHTKAGLVAVYDRYRYEREIGAALALWARYVTLVIDPDLRTAHEAYLARGDAKTRDKARAVFDAAIAEGGVLWDRYLKMVASHGKLVPLRA
jgi:integrase